MRIEGIISIFNIIQKYLFKRKENFSNKKKEEKENEFLKFEELNYLEGVLESFIFDYGNRFWKYEK